MKLLIIRHGQTDANVSRQLQGSRLDQSLNEVGRSQAEAVLPLLQKEQVDAVYASHLKRAYETAEIITNHLGLEVRPTQLISEKDFGELTSKTWDQAHQEFGNEQLRELDRAHAYDYRPYNGESVDQVKERIGIFLDQVQQRHPSQSIIAVTHGGIIRTLYHMLDIEQPSHIDNVSLHTFRL